MFVILRLLSEVQVAEGKDGASGRRKKIKDDVVE